MWAVRWRTSSSISTISRTSNPSSPRCSIQSAQKNAMCATGMATGIRCDCGPTERWITKSTAWLSCSWTCPTENAPKRNSRDRTSDCTCCGKRQRCCSRPTIRRRSSRRFFPKSAPPLGVDTYFNYMLEESGQTLRLASSVGVSEQLASSIQQVPLGQHVCGTVALLRQTIVPKTSSSLMTPRFNWSSPSGFALMSAIR